MKFDTTVINKWLNRDVIILSFFLILSLGIYWNSIGNSFQYDDHIYVSSNRNIRTLKNIPQFFTHPKLSVSDPRQAGHYRPLVVTSYALNYALSGNNPVSYHLFNIAFHIASAFMIFLIMKAMLDNSKQLAVSSKQLEVKSAYCLPLTANYMAALAAGLIFLVHPFNSEAVNYITARSSLMSGFFYLLGFWCWVKYRESAGSNEQLAVSSKQLAGKTAYRSQLTAYYYAGSFLAFVAGMLSKEIVITLPIVCFLYDLYFYHPRQSAVSSKQLADKSAHSSPLTANYLLNWRTYIPYIFFYLMVLIPYIIVRVSSFGGAIPHFNRDIVTQILTELPVLVKYWRMLLIPLSLSPFHYVEIYKTFWSFPVIYSAIILTVIIALVIMLSRLSYYHWRVVSFFGVWFFIVLLPTTIFPLNTIFQENRGYVSAVSFAVFAGVVIGEIGKGRVNKEKGAGRIHQATGKNIGALIILLLLISIYSVAVVQRNRVWKDELSLWSDAVKKYPQSYECYQRLGVVYRMAGMYNQAIEASRRALVLGGGSDYIIYDNIGKVYIGLGKWDLATKALEKSLSGYPNYSFGHNILGVAYYELGKLQPAEEQYKEAIRLDPRSSQPYYNQGVLYTKQGRLVEAVHAYKRAISLEPDYLTAHLNLGILLEENDRKEEASEHYKTVLLKASNEDKELAEGARRRLEKIN